MSKTLDGRRLRLLVDGFERVFLVGLFTWLTWRIWETFEANPFNLIFLAGEAIIVVMVLMRRSTDQITLRPLDWLIGFAGTFLPMMIIPQEQWLMMGVPFLIAGGVISLLAKLSLRRSFGLVAANRGVKATGLYRAVRHPMYLGYFVSYTGVILLNPSVFNAVLLSLWAGCQVYRIHAEERVLIQDPAYQALRVQTRYRLLPFVY